MSNSSRAQGQRNTRRDPQLGSLIYRFDSVKEKNIL